MRSGSNVAALKYLQVSSSVSELKTCMFRSIVALEMSRASERLSQLGDSKGAKGVKPRARSVAWIAAKRGSRWMAPYRTAAQPGSGRLREMTHVYIQTSGSRTSSSIMPPLCWKAVKNVR